MDIEHAHPTALSVRKKGGADKGVSLKNRRENENRTV
jgi:hypothetical protein